MEESSLIVLVQVGANDMRSIGFRRFLNDPKERIGGGVCILEVRAANRSKTDATRRTEVIDAETGPRSGSANGLVNHFFACLIDAKMTVFDGVLHLVFQEDHFIVFL